MVTAQLNNYRQSPRKVRLVVNAIRGKKVSVALTTLSFVPKRAAGPIQKLIESAVANATHNFNLSPDNLYVKEITVGPGATMKRWMPKWRGTAHQIRKRTSHVRVTLATQDGVVVSETAPEVVEKPKKSVTKKASE